MSGSTRDAIEHGVGSTARLITGAALIIVAVFAGFSATDLVSFQQTGFGVAVALLIDATIVRSVVVPAAMRLLGERNWSLPRWLGWLPELQIEDPGAQRPQDGAEDGARLKAAQHLARQSEPTAERRLLHIPYRLDTKPGRTRATRRRSGSATGLRCAAPAA